jgi:homoserine O-acetyltransferase
MKSLETDVASVVQGEWRVRDFRFANGQVADEIHLCYRTLGHPAGRPVLLLHGTTGSGLNVLTPALGGQLFGSGEPLDLRHHWIIVPDCIGHGRSSKPSDGLRARFPRYGYRDAVQLQFRLVFEHLAVQRLFLVMGLSMGGMQAWLWATMHADAMQGVVALGCVPAQLSGRNWMTRRMLVESIRADPAWNQGDYRDQPPSLHFASLQYRLATNGGDKGLYALAPTRALADEHVARKMDEPCIEDANDAIYQWESAADFDPAPGLHAVRAAVLAINSEDDERCPPALGLMEPALAQLPDATYHLIPQGPRTAGHGTIAHASLWKAILAQWMKARWPMAVRPEMENRP